MSKNKKRIDVITKYFLPVTGGIEVNTSETYAVLVKKGWDVVVHTSTDTLNARNTLTELETIKGITVKRYKYKWYGYLPRIDWDDTTTVALHNFNVVPHFYILINSLCRKIIRRKKYGLTLTPHGGYNPDWSVFPLWQSMFKRFYNRLFGLLLINTTVDGVRAVSEWESVEMVKSGIKKKIIHVIPNGLEVEAFVNVDNLASKSIRKLAKSYGKYIIQVGRIYPIKNYETTIRALTHLPREINYLIVGSIELNQHKDYYDQLNSLIKELGLTKRVKFVGVVKGVDKFYLISKSITMVHMATWESFCNVVHEALSQGLVPIVANNTALPYLIKDGENGFLVDTYDEKGVADKVAFILNAKNKQVLKEMGERSRKSSRKHLWSEVASGMDKMYKSVSKL